MLKPQFTAIRVSKNTLDDWFSIAPSIEAGARDKLLAEISGQSNLVRLVLYDDTGPISVCAAEVCFPGAIIWPPRMRSSLEPSLQSMVMVNTALHLIQVCIESQVKYVECTIRDGGLQAADWSNTLLSLGFELVSRKCRWERSLEVLPITRDVGKIDINFECTDAHSHRVDHLYSCTLEDSRDRSTVYEGGLGSGLGDASQVIMAVTGQRDIGLCALEFDEAGERGWIKYVGVIPQFRRSGVARMLLASGMAIFAEAGIKYAECLIDIDNHISRVLHQDLGFCLTADCGNSYYYLLSKAEPFWSYTSV